MEKTEYVVGGYYRKGELVGKVAIPEPSEIKVCEVEVEPEKLREVEHCLFCNKGPLIFIKEFKGPQFQYLCGHCKKLQRSFERLKYVCEADAGLMEWVTKVEQAMIKEALKGSNKEE